MCQMERKGQKEEGGRKFPTLNKWDQIRWKEGKRRERKKKEEGKWSEKHYLLSKIYGDWAVDFRRSKKQSSSTRRELRVGTRIWGFCQTPRGRGFSPTLVVLGLRVI